MKRTFVPPSGNNLSTIAIVGEQPGFREVKHNPPKPFVGPAGQALNECLRLAKINRRDIYLTNVIKDLDAPLKAYIDIGRGNPTVSQNGYQYINELADELHTLKQRGNLNIVVALGNIAMFALTNRIGITKWRGSILDSTTIPGLKVIPTFHPATFIPPKFNYINKPIITDDLCKAKIQSEFPEIRRIERNIVIKMSFNDAINILNHCYEVGLRGQTIGIDIEVINGELDCISFAWDRTHSSSIPFRDQKGDYFTVEQESEIMLLIAKIIQSEKIAKSGANFIFDTQFILHKYGIRPRGKLLCTQIAQKIAFPDLKAGLDAVTTMHTDVPYYKQDGKEWMKMQTGTWEKWWNYNGMDALIPVEAIPKQMRILAAQHNEQTYERQLKLIKPLIYMSERGIKVDVQGIVKHRNDQQKELDRLSEELNIEVGYDINYNSPKQLSNYFYKELGIKPYKKRTAKGTYTTTTDVDALKRLSRRGIKAAQIMLDIRSLSKRISTYLDIGKIDSDGRMRSSYKPVGAETGRISSGSTIFGKGCMPPDAEALTQSGWRSLYELSINNKDIMQWDSVSNELSWCTPNINVYDFKGSMIKADSSIHKALYTPDHRIPTISKRGILTEYKADQVKDKSNWFLPLSGKYTSGIIKLPSVELLAIIQADGAIEGNGVRFSFTKQRKIDRFLYIMKKYNVDFTEQSAKLNYRRFYIKSSYAKHYINVLMSSGKKSFGPWIFMLDYNSLNILLEEIKYWDAHIRNNSFIFYTIDKQNAEWVATLAHLCNKSATITSQRNSEKAYGNRSLIYNVNIKPRNKVYQHKDMYTERYYNWKVYSPTVDTSYFLCRYRGTIFITGNSNAQNWPHDLLTFFKFDEGYIGYSFDLSQIENRIVAYTGGVISQIKAFETGIDLHTLTASIVLNKPYDEISSEDGSSPLGDGRQSERYWGKKGNHAANYSVGYRKFALVNEMGEREAKEILARIYKGYPQLVSCYQKMIQDMLKTNRTVTNLFGRTRLFLGPVIPQAPFIPKSACEATYREAYAHLPQSTCADKVNEQGLEYIYYNQDLFKPIELLSQVHDSVVFQIPLSIPWEEHARMLMLIKRSLEQPLKWRNDEFPTPCDLAIGFNMGKKNMIEIKSKSFPDSLGDLAVKLESIYHKLCNKQMENNS